MGPRVIVNIMFKFSSSYMSLNIKPYTIEQGSKPSLTPLCLASWVSHDDDNIIFFKLGNTIPPATMSIEHSRLRQAGRIFPRS